MNEETYLKLLSLVAPFIEKKDTIMREAISPHERLTATLRFLATGRTYEDLKFSTIISPQSLSKIIPETCQVTYEVLKKDYLKFPQTENDWKNIANDFEKRWNFPHCLGALDGKHVEIVPPAGSGSYFYNYKQRHSMVLLAIADAQYRLILFDFGTNGRISDGGVLQNSQFFRKLQNNLLNIPKESEVGNQRYLPYVFVVDDAFPLRTDMIKPFRQSDLTSIEKKIYNYRLSRARRIIENVFGILASRFRIFHTAINLELNNIDCVVKASCALHNFLVSNVGESYVHEESLNFGNLQPLENTRQGSTLDAKKVRENFMNYFANEGQVSWQTNFVH